MIRLTLLCGLVSFLAVYAWRDWYKVVCGLIVLMAIIEHPDMPKTLFGLQGLNPWNILLLIVLIAWLMARNAEALTWDMPTPVQLLLLLYLGVVVIGFVRMILDPSYLDEYSTGELVSEHLLNTLKWVIPGFLLFDGCRSKRRFVIALASVLALYVLLALQVIKWMPPGEAFSGEALSNRSLKVLLREVGYHRVNLSMLLAGASWALLASIPLLRRRLHIVLVAAASLVVLYAQALTGGRMGYATWLIVGLVLGLARWRRYLLLLPLVVIVLSLALPSAIERLFEGFSAETRDTNQRLSTPDSDMGSADDGPDAYTITAGRTVAWPLVVDKIADHPLLGYGRLAMRRTGIAAKLLADVGEDFPHPHNAYLELLLDSGLVGLLLVMPFYLVMLTRSLSLLRDTHPVCVSIGGVACSLVLALLVASIGSQTFYPREGAVGMWAALGLMLRISVDRARAGPALAWWMQPHDAPAMPAAPGSVLPSHSPRPWWQAAA
jgi:O-antigen ligase